MKKYNIYIFAALTFFIFSSVVSAQTAIQKDKKKPNSAVSKKAPVAEKKAPVPTPQKGMMADPKLHMFVDPGNSTQNTLVKKGTTITVK